jgi:hypothetical protein
MIIKFLFLIVLLGFLFWSIHQYKKTAAEKRPAQLIKLIIYGAAGLLLLGVITGRLHWLSALFAAALPLLRWGLLGATRLIPLWLSHSGGKAAFKTEHLDVIVNVTNGHLSGKIIKGLYVDTAISELTDEQLNELEEYYRDKDSKSYYLIKFARKTHRANNNGNNHHQPPAFGDPSRDEALQILGLSGNPSREDIIAAHRRLINKLHPDRGGSDFLAARVNQARDTLLGKK